MKSLVDNQLPPALARYITQDLGVDSPHVADIDLQSSSDSHVWSYASSNGFILVSKDDDFLTSWSGLQPAMHSWKLR